MKKLSFIISMLFLFNLHSAAVNGNWNEFLSGYQSCLREGEMPPEGVSKEYLQGCGVALKVRLLPEHAEVQVENYQNHFVCLSKPNDFAAWYRYASGAREFLLEQFFSNAAQAIKERKGSWAGGCR
jgi:hypothetical protein